MVLEEIMSGGRQVKGAGGRAPRLPGLHVCLFVLSGLPWGENGGAGCCGTRLWMGVSQVGVRVEE